MAVREPRARPAPQVVQPPRCEVLAAVWKAQSQKLGIAFMDGSVLRFCEVVDAKPDFAILQSIKFALNPELIVTPISADLGFVDRLRAPTTTPAKAEMAEDEEDASGLDVEAADVGFPVKPTRSRDFACETAQQRLALLSSLSELPEQELTERERLMNIEHMLPSDLQQARRAHACT